IIHLHNPDRQDQLKEALKQKNRSRDLGAQVQTNFGVILIALLGILWVGFVYQRSGALAAAVNLGGWFLLNWVAYLKFIRPPRYAMSAITKSEGSSSSQPTPPLATKIAAVA